MIKRDLKAPKREIFVGAKKIIRIIRDSGADAYIVGGAVRDLLLHKKIKDIDIVCNLEIEKLKKIFPNSELIGAAFGVIIVKIDGYTYEIASCREERQYLDGRHPEFIKYTKSFEIDSKRRDFTINAMLYDVENEYVIDYNNGLVDLDNGILRSVGDAQVRLKEDYLRMLRAIRFATNLNFELDENLYHALSSLSCYCSAISVERIRAEFDKMLLSRGRVRAIELMQATGILKEILPEISQLQGVTQSPIYHPEGDVFTHTLIMLNHIAIANLPLVWSVLLHDIGKFYTKTEDERGIHFYSHEVAGAKLSRKLMERLKFPEERIKKVEKAILNHMRFANIPQMKEAKVLKIIGDKNFALELELNRLDCISCHGRMDSFYILLDKIIENSGRTILPPPIVSGKLLLELGLKSGPNFSKIIDVTYDLQLSKKINNQEEAIAYIQELIAKNNF